MNNCTNFTAKNRRIISFTIKILNFMVKDPNSRTKSSIYDQFKIREKGSV